MINAIGLTLSPPLPKVSQWSKYHLSNNAYILTELKCHLHQSLSPHLTLFLHTYFSGQFTERSGMASLRKCPEGYSRENWDWYGRRERDRDGGRQTDRQRDLIGSAWIALAKVQGET